MREELTDDLDDTLPADETVEVGNTRPVPGCTSVRACADALAEAGFTSQGVGAGAGNTCRQSRPRARRGDRAVPGRGTRVSDQRRYVTVILVRPRLNVAASVADV